MPAQPEITRLLAAARAGDRDAENDLLRLLYDELRVMAHRQLGRYHPDQTLNTTALVHEAYLKLAGAEQLNFQDRRHFLAISARAMRQVLIDYARSKRAQKRGGGAHHRTLDGLDGEQVRIAAEAEALLALDAALAKLAALDERLARVVELRFYAGLSVEETADVLGVSVPTVKRDTRAARAFLHRHMGLSVEGGA